MRPIAMVILPLLATMLFAQYETRTTTTKTTWDGTLVDADCQNTRVEHQEATRQTNPDRSVTTRTETIRTRMVDCPATTATSAFGLLTSDGRFFRFDDVSNARVIEYVHNNQALSRSLAESSPLRVSVIGTANGGLAVVESVNPHGSAAVTVAEAGRVVHHGPADVMFDVRHGDDRGKLVVTDTGVHFEDISDADHSRSWSYSEIKELERKGDRKIEIETYSGDDFELRMEGPGMSDAVYQIIADRIVEARTR